MFVNERNKNDYYKYYVDSIKTVFDSIFKEGTIYLFGSRVYDTKKGGDIDLFIEIEDKTRLIEQEARKWAVAL